MSSGGGRRRSRGWSAAKIKVTAMAAFADGAKKSSIEEPTFVTISGVVSSSQGGKDYQEDMAVKIDDFNRYIPKKSNVDWRKRRAFYAVFDGHGGARCSKFLAENFHEMLARHPLIDDSPEEAIKRVWMEAEERFLDMCSRKYRQGKEAGEAMHFQKSGSTAVVVFVVGDRVLIGNCGDSHAYLYTTDQAPQRLSDDHNTSNEVEVARVRAAGATVEQELQTRRKSCFSTERVRVGKHRVWPGGLAITRSFGDFHAKLEAFGGVADSVLSDYEQLRDLTIASEWEGIVLASDGVWDALSPEAVWGSFKKHTAASGRKDIADKMGEAVEVLIEQCCDSTYWRMHGYSADNTTAIALTFGDDWHLRARPSNSAEESQGPPLSPPFASASVSPEASPRSGRPGRERVGSSSTSHLLEGHRPCDGAYRGSAHHTTTSSSAAGDSGGGGGGGGGSGTRLGDVRTVEVQPSPRAAHMQAQPALASGRPALSSALSTGRPSGGQSKRVSFST